MVTVNSSGTAAARAANSDSVYGYITGDGRYVFFVSSRNELVEGLDQNSVQDTYRRDMLTDRTELVTVGRNGLAVGGSIPYFTPDGRFVIFSSTSTNIITPDLNGAASDVFRRDLQTNTTILVSFDKTVFEDDQVQSAGLTPDGRFALLFKGRPSEGPLYLCDLQLGTTTLVNPTITGVPSRDPAKNPRVSDDGRFVLFGSNDPNLVPNDTNRTVQDLFLRDMHAQTTTRINAPADSDAVLMDATRIFATSPSSPISPTGKCSFMTGSPDVPNRC